MKQNKEKYLVITEFDTIDSKCSNCSLAGINLHFYPNKIDIIRKIAEASQYSNLKVTGIYKEIDKLEIDKNLCISEVEE